MKAIQSLSLFAAFLLMCSFLNPSTSPSSPPNWRFVADKWVNYGVDHDVIVFGNLKDDFRQIRLRVTDAPLRMYDLKIYFDNGDVQDVRLQTNFRQGEESRVIDLVGGLRHLRKIEFWYETKGAAKGKARIAVWGKN
jgi:hypothetical protein